MINIVESQKSVTHMSEAEKALSSIFKSYGLTDREAEVYLFLTKNESLKAKDISNGIRMHKAQVYRILKKLQGMGIVEATVEFPMRFTTIPFERFINQRIDSKREEVRLLEEKKPSLLDYWESISIQETPFLSHRFMVLKGSDKIASTMLRMISEAEDELLAVITMSVVSRAYRREFIEALLDRKIRLRVLVHVTEDNYELVKVANDRVSLAKDKLGLSMEGRHVDLDSRGCLRFFIKDGNESVLFITPEEGVDSEEEIALWTNSPLLIYAQTLFEELWRNATPIREKLCEFETQLN